MNTREKVYLVEYYEPRTNTLTSIKINAPDKTDARDKFFEKYPGVQHLLRITWLPNAKD